MSTRSPPSTRHSETACSSARQLGSDGRRDVAELKRPLLVEDRDRVRVVGIVGLGHERQPTAGVEGRIVERLRPVGDAGDGDDTDPRILPAHWRLGLGVAEVVAALTSFEPQAEPVRHLSSL